MRHVAIGLAALIGGALPPASVPQAAFAQAAAAPATAAPDPREPGFEAFLASLRPRARAEGVSARTLDTVLPTLTFNPKVVALDRDQPGQSSGGPSAFIAYAPYRAKHVDADRIARGRAAYAGARAQLSGIEAKTGVPESVMVAIWGSETNYGGFTGNFDLARSLATLAYDGRRRELFTSEFIATLKLIDQGVPRAVLKGSWAGATGYPQFMPSMYARLGADGDGDGKIDIWTDRADALASIGNYLVDAGWQPRVPWGVAVSVPVDLDRKAIASRLVSPRCPRVFARMSRWMTLKEWRALGVVPVSTPPVGADELATLIEPDGPGATAYLTFGNYRAILDYNCSNFYALSVGLLADAVSR